MEAWNGNGKPTKIIDSKLIYKTACKKSKWRHLNWEKKTYSHNKQFGCFEKCFCCCDSSLILYSSDFQMFRCIKFWLKQIHSSKWGERKKNVCRTQKLRSCCWSSNLIVEKRAFEKLELEVKNRTCITRMLNSHYT